MLLHMFTLNYSMFNDEINRFIPHIVNCITGSLCVICIFRIMSDARELTEFPSLNGTSALEILRLDRASLYSVPSSLCRTCPKLKSL